jgi:hypothetical protein
MNKPKRPEWDIDFLTAVPRVEADPERSVQGVKATCFEPEKSFLDRRTGAAGLTRAVFESADLDKITLHDLEQFIHPLCSLCSPWLILLDSG